MIARHPLSTCFSSFTSSHRPYLDAVSLCLALAPQLARRTLLAVELVPRFLPPPPPLLFSSSRSQFRWRRSPSPQSQMGQRVSAIVRSPSVSPLKRRCRHPPSRALQPPRQATTEPPKRRPCCEKCCL